MEMETADADASFIGSVSHQGLGDHDQVVVEDVDGDGMDDILFSSSHHPVGTWEGEVFVFFGLPRIF